MHDEIPAHQHWRYRFYSSPSPPTTSHDNVISHVTVHTSKALPSTSQMHELVILSTRSEDDSRPTESSNMQYSLLQNDTIVHLRRQVTLRATIAGLAIGSMILFSNFQFGLQTGWVSMMSLPSALISYAVFRAFPGLTKEFPFTREENVYAQSVAVAVGTGPLAFGLVGIVPAIEKLLTPEENSGEPIFMHIGQLILWSLSLSLFGVFLPFCYVDKSLLESSSSSHRGPLPPL